VVSVSGERHEVIYMNADDLGGTAGPSASKTPRTVSPPWTRPHPFGRLARPTDPLRVPLITAFCTADIDAPTLSYMPRLPKEASI